MDDCLLHSVCVQMHNDTHCEGPRPITKKEYIETKIVCVCVIMNDTQFMTHTVWLILGLSYDITYNIPLVL